MVGTCFSHPKHASDEIFDDRIRRTLRRGVDSTGRTPIRRRVGGNREQRNVAKQRITPKLVPLRRARNRNISSRYPQEREKRVAVYRGRRTRVAALIRTTPP